MTAPQIKNMGASVRQRLLNYAQTSRRPFGEVLQYYAMERFLYRLSVSPHSGRFLLKGALLLTEWRAPASRPTMDIDLLGRANNEVERIVQLMKEVVQVDVPNDGIVFDPASFAGGPFAKIPTILEFALPSQETWLRPEFTCRSTSASEML